MEKSLRESSRHLCAVCGATSLFKDIPVCADCADWSYKVKRQYEKIISLSDIGSRTYESLLPEERHVLDVIGSDSELLNSAIRHLIRLRTKIVNQGTALEVSPVMPAILKAVP